LSVLNLYRSGDSVLDDAHSSLENQIRSAILNGQKEEATKLAQAAYASKDQSEEMLAWIAGVLHEKRIKSAFPLMNQFIERFPDSLQLPRIYLADIYANLGQFDRASLYARIYLRLAKDRGILDRLENLNIAREGVSKAFLLLTAAYTELGARSYSKRVLQYARHLHLTESMAKFIDEELHRLDQELRNSENIAVDQTWEKFFVDGVAHANEIIQRCQDKGFPDLALRMRIIYESFRADSSFRVDSQEMFMIPVTMANGSAMLR
jgi:tetratricopeptide (TPR) repeat protein